MRICIDSLLKLIEELLGFWPSSEEISSMENFSFCEENPNKRPIILLLLDHKDKGKYTLDTKLGDLCLNKK